MVLTQLAASGTAITTFSLGFHTTMVLTQQGGKNVDSNQRIQVSIPLWFLRNRILRCSVCGKTDFVSIPLWFLRNSRYPRRERPDILRFHTTMVLTQPPRYSMNCSVPRKVSIPLWFLRNLLKKKKGKPAQTLFPYHYGSYAT